MQAASEEKRADVDIDLVKAYDKAIFDALQAGTEDKAYVYVTRAAPPDMFDIRQDLSGVP